MVWFSRKRRADSTIQVNADDHQEGEQQTKEFEEDQFIQINQLDETATVKTESQGNNFVSTLIVILFLIHPTITREMFALFNCKEIDGIPRLYFDLETICYESDHMFLLKWVAAPSLIVYSLGIPTLGLYILMRNSDNLEKQSVKRAYGFLYNGYKKGFSQYWEIIIIYRKVLLIFIQIFLIQRGKISQALFTLLFLILSIVMLKKLSPYSKGYLNTLEMISLFTSTASVYFGIFDLKFIDLLPPQIINNLHIILAVNFLSHSFSYRILVL